MSTSLYEKLLNFLKTIYTVRTTEPYGYGFITEHPNTIFLSRRDLLSFRRLYYDLEPSEEKKREYEQNINSIYKTLIENKVLLLVGTVQDGDITRDVVMEDFFDQTKPIHIVLNIYYLEKEADRIHFHSMDILSDLEKRM